LSFTLAHLSDPHLPNLRLSQVLRNFSGKRVIGGFSWFLNRRRRHLQSVADAVQASIIGSAVDHVALTGDIVNIAAWSEFKHAASWVQRFGPPERVSFVPGNHDAYVKVPWAQGLNTFSPWMRPDRFDPMADAQHFPFVRMRRNIALIGLNSGSPQGYRRASGTLGAPQLRDLGNILGLLGQQGFYRVVMIHHPPLPGQNTPRKALTDAAALKAVLQEQGCNLVIHGHNHKSMLTWLDTKGGAVPIIGAPSASINGDEKHEAAGWNHYHIRRTQNRWLTDMTAFRWNRASQLVEQRDTVTLSPP
jgi:3',5'-cyclic AMP phosphodiesterase CpdA